MRLSSLQWLLCAASSTVTAASAAAKVYVYDSDASSQAAPSPEAVDAATARLILAQRLGLSQFHTIAQADDESIRQVNAFSSQQKALFGHERHPEPISRVMIVVEGMEETSMPSWNDLRSFSIPSAPHPSDSYELFSTFAAEAAQLPAKDGQDQQILKALQLLSDAPGSLIKSSANRQIFLHVKTTPDVDYTTVLDEAVVNIHDLAQTRKISLSVLFTPSAAKSSKPSKSPFGLTKRAAKAQRNPAEEPLLSHKQMAPSASSHASATGTSRATKVLTGAIPTCFSSMSACERGTNNCTSHGECVLKWSTETTNDGGSISKQDCFGCACTKPDVRKNKDGTKKTTTYGGGACHKKDIVFPFWLLTGVTVFIIFIVSWGIGLLYEMGSQELPSVIGAGVSGPKASR